MGYKKYYCLSVVMSLSFLAASVPMMAQEQNEPDLMEVAEQEADRLQTLLDLEDWQVFYVDSTLKSNYPAMHEELMGLQKAKVSNASMYQSVQDKWMEKIDSSYMTIFNDEQWKAYLKSGAAKRQKARAKRRAKAEGTYRRK